MNRSSPFSNHAVPEAGAPTVSLQIPYNHAVPEAGTPRPTAANRNEP
jgi:hypothetical protein